MVVEPYTIPSSVYNLNSQKNTITQELTYVLPKDKDIQSICFTEDPPKYIKAVEIRLGGQRLVYVDQVGIGRGSDMLVDCCGDGLQRSKCIYMRIDMLIEIDKQFLLENEEFKTEPEMKNVEYLSDEEYDFFDGHDYHRGKRVRRTVEPTGEMARVVTRSVLVECPAIQVTLKDPSTLSKNDDHITVVWQNIELNGCEEPLWIETLRFKRDLKLMDENFPDLDAAIASKQPFKGRVKNFLRFQEGMAGLYY